MSKTSKLTGTR